MADIIYSRNNWSKGNVLTAQRLNATEIALETVINRVNGKNNEETLSSDEALATEYYVNSRINEFTEDSGATNKTITSIGTVNNKIKVTYSDIVLADGSTKGLATAGTNLSASNGTISLIASPTISGNLTVNGTSNLVGSTTIGAANNTSNILQVYGNTNITGNITIAGTTTMNDSLLINDSFTAMQGFTVGNITQVEGGESVSYNYDTVFNTYRNTINSPITSFDGASVVIGTDTETNGNHTYNGTLTINSATEFKQPLTNLTIGTDEYIDGTHHYAGSLIIKATTEFENETNFNGFTKFNGTNIIIGTNNNNIYDGTLDVNALAVFYNTTTFNNTVNFDNTVNFTDTVILSSNSITKNFTMSISDETYTCSTLETIDNPTGTYTTYLKIILPDDQERNRKIYSYCVANDSLTIGEHLGNWSSAPASLLLRGQDISLKTGNAGEGESLHSITLSSDMISLDSTVKYIVWDRYSMSQQDFIALLALVQEANNNDGND